MQQAPMRKNNLLAVSIAAVLGLGASGSAFAVNGYQLIGFGADQVAVGGAVTASPESAMTALTNPAGLGMVGERADFSMEAFMPDVKADFSRNVFTGNMDMGAGAGETAGPAGPGEVQKSKGTLYGIPSIGWVAKTSNPNLYFGGGMYATAGLGAEYGTVNLNSGGLSAIFSGGLATTAPTTLNGFSNVGLFRIAPSMAYKLSDQVSLGASLNIGLQQFSARETVSDPAMGTLVNFNLGRAGQAFGLGASVGAMVDVVPSVLRVGASYISKANFQKTKFQLDRGDINNPMGFLGGPIHRDPTTGAPTGGAPAGEYAADLDFPQQAAIGFAILPQGPVSISADVKWIDYSSTLRNFYVTGPDGTYNLNPGWKDVNVYALGIRIKPTDAMQLMAGYNYSTSPVKENTVLANVIFPAIVKHHITAGFKYQLGESWDVGGAFQYIPREQVTGKNDLNPELGFGNSSSVTLSNQITTMSFNLGYRF